MKYYGLRRKRFNEELIYTYAKQRAQIFTQNTREPKEILE